MDFKLIEDHPWITTGAILGGGFVLYLLFHRSSSTADTTSSGAVVQSVDPNAQAAATALQSQQDQISGSIQGLSLQGQTQIGLATLGAGVQSQSILASQDVTNRQTAAQLQLGLGNLDAQVQAQQIQATTQMNLVDVLSRLFGGGNSPVTATPVSNTSSNPVNTSNTPSQIAVTPPAYIPSNPSTNTGAITDWSGTVVPGGATLVPLPNYAVCDPMDSACVLNNGSLNTSYVQSVSTAQAKNNRNQCLANAELSAGKPNYAALVAACG